MQRVVHRLVKISWSEGRAGFVSMVRAHWHQLCIRIAFNESDPDGSFLDTAAGRSQQSEVHALRQNDIRQS